MENHVCQMLNQTHTSMIACLVCTHERKCYWAMLYININIRFYGNWKSPI